MVYAKEYDQVQMEVYDEELDQDTALEIAIAESLEEMAADVIDFEGGDVKGHGASVEAARATLPDYCHLHSIEPGGWCFYDCVLAHLGRPLPAYVTRHRLAIAILEALARDKSHFKHLVIDDEAETLKYRDDVLSSGGEDLYISVLDQLDDFDYYVLSKLEACFEETNVLDTHQYEYLP